MRKGDLTQVAGSLRQAQKRLREKSLAVQAEWSDAASRRFEETCLAPLEFQLLATVKSLDKLSQALHRAHAECGESAE